jgi:hypothetical protein
MGFGFRRALVVSGRRGRSDPAKKHEDQENDKEEAKASAWIITPTPAVGPTGQGTDQKENKDNEENGSDGHEFVPSPSPREPNPAMGSSPHG